MKMEDLAQYMKYFAGLLAVLNPVGAIPVFVSLTANQSGDERRRTALLASLTVVLVLGTALVAGEGLLRFFGITISSFRVGGGILILIMAISMMHAHTSAVKHTSEEARDVMDRDSVAVVPLGIPLLAGPGSISTVVLYAHRDPSLVNHVVIGAEILVLSFLIWAAFRLAPYISRMLGKTGINVVTRVMGLILAAIGVEFIAGGLRELLPGLS